MKWPDKNVSWGDVLAIVVAALALTHTCYRTHEEDQRRTQGPDIQLFAPDQIVIHRFVYPQRTTPYVRFSADFDFINRSPFGLPAALRREELVIRFDGQAYRHRWRTFEQFNSVDEQLKSNQTIDAQMQALGPGGVLSHHTFLAPREYENFIAWDEFLRAVRSGQSVTFELEATFQNSYGANRVRAGCRVDGTSTLAADLEAHGWAGPPCEPVSLE